METKYGFIAIIEENGVKKFDAKNTKFKSVDSVYQFLHDAELLKQIFGY